MKMTMEKYLELVKEDEAKREALREEIHELSAKADSYRAARALAGSKGDGETFVEMDAEWKKTHSIMNVKQQYLDNLPRIFTEKDALEAWAGYADNHNTKIRKALAAFEAERAKLYKMYSDLVTLQQEALETREHMADAAGSDKEKFAIEYIPVRSGMDKGVLRMGGFNCADPDVCYYLANFCRDNNVYLTTSTGEMRPEAQRINNVVVQHVSK